MMRLRTMLVAVGVVGLVAAGCSDDSDDASEPTTTEEAITTSTAVAAEDSTTTRAEATTSTEPMSTTEATSTTTTDTTTEPVAGCRAWNGDDSRIQLQEFAEGVTDAVVIDTGLLAPNFGGPLPTVWLVGLRPGDYTLVHISTDPPEQNLGGLDNWNSLDQRTSDVVGLLPITDDFLDNSGVPLPEALAGAAAEVSACFDQVG